MATPTTSRMAGSPWPIRIAAIGAVVVAVGVLALLLFRGDGYTVTGEFLSGGQLVEGNLVKVAGAEVGTVEEVEISDNGLALVRFTVNDDYAPLRRGTRAMIKQTSLSGIANRFIDLHLGPADGEEIDDGGRLGTSETQTAVEIDEVFGIFDPETRRALQDTIKGQADLLRGRGRQINRAVKYLNPALSTGARLFRELSRDEPLLERFLVDSGRFVNALARRRADVRGLVSNANTTFRALGAQQQALAEAVGLLPPFMRRANTTFVNLRRALDDVDPLVSASIPVAALPPDGPGPQPHDPPPRSRQRPDRADADVPAAGARRARSAARERRRAQGRLPGVRGGAGRVGRHLLAASALHPRPRRLVRGLLGHGRLRRRRRVLALPAQPDRDPLRARTADAPVQALPGRRRRARRRRQQRALRFGAGEASMRGI
jgi:virulence factor Mce-like protein